MLLNSSGELDTDKFVGKVTETVESVPNAANIAAYGAAGFLALSVVDGIVNLPLLNILLGVPVQIVGATAVRPPEEREHLSQGGGRPQRARSFCAERQGGWLRSITEGGG